MTEVTDLELFIEIDPNTNQPINHPIHGENFRHALSHIDPDNLPPHYARFVRVLQNVTPSLHQTVEHKYDWVGDVVKDVWYTVDLPDEEVQKKLDHYQTQCENVVGFLKTFAQKRIEQSVNSSEIQVFTNYLNKLNNWTFDANLAVEHQIPIEPRARTSLLLGNGLGNYELNEVVLQYSQDSNNSVIFQSSVNMIDEANNKIYVNTDLYSPHIGVPLEGQTSKAKYDVVLYGQKEYYLP